MRIHVAPACADVTRPFSSASPGHGSKGHDDQLGPTPLKLPTRGLHAIFQLDVGRGCRQRGDANLDSDWDILVVVPEASVPADPLVAWRLRRDTGVRADVIVYSSREFEAERDVPNTLAYEATSAGVALYER